MLAVLGYLIYELNKCAVTMSNANVVGCDKQFKVCATFVSKKDSFSSILTSLPTKAIKRSMLKIDKANTENRENDKKGKDWEETVGGMKNIDDLRHIIATLVTGTKADEVSTRMSAQCHVIVNELVSYEWSKFTSGTCLRFNIN